MLVNIPYMQHMGLLEESFKRCPWSWLTLKLLGCRSKQFSAHSGWGNEHCKDLPFWQISLVLEKIWENQCQNYKNQAFFSQSVKVQTCQMSLWILWLLYHNYIPSFIGYTLRCDWKRNPRRRCRALRRGPWTRNTNVCLVITTLGTGKIMEKSHRTFHKWWCPLGGLFHEGYPFIEWMIWEYPSLRTPLMGIWWDFRAWNHVFASWDGETRMCPYW